MSVKNIFFGYPDLSNYEISVRTSKLSARRRIKFRSLSMSQAKIFTFYFFSLPQAKNLLFGLPHAKNFDFSACRRRKFWLFCLPQAKILIFQPAAGENFDFSAHCTWICSRKFENSHMLLAKSHFLGPNISVGTGQFFGYLGYIW